MPPLVLGEVLVVFVNRLTADASILFKILRICQQKIFCQFFVPFLESTSNFKDFGKKDDGHS